MIENLKNPKLFIVKGKNEGIRVQVNVDTLRVVGRTTITRNDTLRIIYRTDSFYCDTARKIHNMNNIQFDTRRKINRQEELYVDTFRRVKSLLPVYNHSLYVHSKTGKPIECVIFSSTKLFPYKDKYMHVILDNGDTGYVPLAPVGSEMDSGLRYTMDNGEVWQICSNVIYNILDTFLVDRNYFINTLSADYVYRAFRAIFGGHVSRQGKDIYLLTPQFDCGVSKLFMIGVDLRITWIDETETDWSKGVTLTTYNNGVCDTSFGGEEKYKANAMLVKLEPRKKYKITYYDSCKWTSYTPEERVKGCFIIGRDVEALPEESASYESLVQTDSYCTLDEKIDVILHASENTDDYYFDAWQMKNNWLKYTNSRRWYQYYEGKKLKYTE